jgi:hypothetical protein
VLGPQVKRGAAAPRSATTSPCGREQPRPALRCPGAA